MAAAKPKINRAGDEKKVSNYDQCLTPPYALEPLYPYLNTDPSSVIWESACGERHLAEAIAGHGFSVLGTDLTIGDEFNFFSYSPDHWQWSVQITNPPYSIKRKWVKRSYELGKPFALLLPVEYIGSSEAQDMMEEYGYEIMLLDARVDFKMPEKGWKGSGAQFPVMWYCWKLLPEAVMFGSIKQAKTEWKEKNKHLFKEVEMNEIS